MLELYKWLSRREIKNIGQDMGENKIRILDIQNKKKKGEKI